MLSADRDHRPVQSHFGVPSPRLSKTVRATGRAETERDKGHRDRQTVPFVVYALPLHVTVRNY